jgi:plastocyanin
MFRLLKVMIAIIFLLLPAISQATHFHVAIASFAFSPESLNIRVSDTVTWTNNDAVNHTSTSNTGVWSSPVLSTEQSFSFIFHNIGHFPYHCAIHTFMLGVIVVSQATGINDPGSSGQLPDKLELSSYPNPFNASTEIVFNLPQAEHVNLNIYDITGRLLTNLADQQMPAGIARIIWNGTDSRGNHAASGVYFIRMETDLQTTAHRVVLLK